MTFSLPCLDNQFTFPDVHLALDEPNGLLAYGGDLSPQRILTAYQHGIFPWFSDDDPILWWSPTPRAVIAPQDFSPSKSLRKHVKRSSWRVTLNQCTDKIIQLCASTRPKEETWITDEMINAYIQLAQLGHYHSVEVWHDEQLIGGLYGIKLGRVFCGESMFSLESNASKVAFWHLCDYFSSVGGQLIDCQMMNPHLQRLGVIEIPRKAFIQQLEQLQQHPIAIDAFAPKTLSLTTTA